MNTLNPVEMILKASTPTELFHQGTKTYRTLVKQVHPDTYSGTDAQGAEQAYLRLMKLWEQWKQPQSSNQSNIIKTKCREYVLGEKSSDGVMERFEVTYDQGHKAGFMSLPQSAQDNDLLLTARNSIERLNKEVPRQYTVFFPSLIELLSVSTDVDSRKAITYSYPLEGFVSLEDVLNAYPDGIHGRDIVWIYKRVLTALGNAADVNLVHGAVNAKNVWIHPADHGLVLDCWEYSVEKGNSLKAVPPYLKDVYPSAVVNKQAVDHTLDVYLANKMMLSLCDADVPRPLRRLLSSKAMLHPKYILRQVNEAAREAYGEPRFHEFKMPNTYNAY